MKLKIIKLICYFCFVISIFMLIIKKTGYCIDFLVISIILFLIIRQKKLNSNQKNKIKKSYKGIENMNKEFIFKSMNDGKTIVKLNNNSITISRPGLMSKFSHGFSGEKTILIKNISSVQVKEAGISRGYIQFTIMGSIERKSGILSGAKDENIIYFDSSFNNKEINNQANKIKEFIENFNSEKQINIIQNNEDNYDKLLKLKKLLDVNIITQEEFEKEKQKLLSN